VETDVVWLWVSLHVYFAACRLTVAHGA
jgi:hypothetical protein